MSSTPMKLSARVSAPIDDVRRALTDPAELRVWLAEHAEVDLPHTYTFWGRYTPEGEEPAQTLQHVDDHTLRFTWRLSGQDTTVEFGLTAEDAATTIVSLSQSHVPDLADVIAETPLAILLTFWSLAIANLVDHLEGRELTPKCDFTSTTMRESITVGAAPEEVFASLMEPERFAQWFGYAMRIEPHVGGRWAMGEDFSDEKSVARIIELEPGRKLSLDWGSVVSTWELAGSAGKTRLTFVNSGFDEDDPPYADWTGWLSGTAALRRYHELPDWRPIWVVVQSPGIPDGAFITS